jgi:hypothetical protein
MEFCEDWTYHFISCLYNMSEIDMENYFDVLHPVVCLQSGIPSTQPIYFVFI